MKVRCELVELSVIIYENYFEDLTTPYIKKGKLSINDIKEDFVKILAINNFQLLYLGTKENLIRVVVNYLLSKGFELDDALDSIEMVDSVVIEFKIK